MSDMYRNNADNALLSFYGKTLVFIALLTATYLHQQYKWNLLFRFYTNRGYANAPQCNVVHTFPTFLVISKTE